MDMILLRESLHAAVDRVVDDLLAPQSPGVSPQAASSEHVDVLGAVEPFTFAWPADYGSEHFTSSTAYRVSALGRDAGVVVGWTTRYAWSADRRRAVVFHRARSGDAPTKWYPWTEFVETDTGGFAALIPNPQRPRAILKDGASLPDRFHGKSVARSDALFDSIREGASLRLVVDERDETEMVRHGYWVAQLRGRV